MAKKQSVLIIDDSPTVRRLADLALTKEGYIVYTAEDGDIGLEIAKREVPSVIIVDFIMPKMNGFQLCKNIRSDSLLKDVPIVLITSKGEDVGQGFDEKFGIIQYLQKPFEAETLTNTVKDVLAGGEEESGASPEDVATEQDSEYSVSDNEQNSDEHLQADTLSDVSFVDISATNISFSEGHGKQVPPPNSSLAGTSGDELPSRKQSVLVIDDSSTVRKLAESALSEKGYEVFTAEDGDVGLEIARKEVPSVILVDFVMPKMNGFQLCKSIRSDPILKDIPIVLITSKGKDVGQGFDEKFDIARYLQKPFESETLTNTVKDVLTGGEEEAGGDAEALADEEHQEYPGNDRGADSQEPQQANTLSSDIAFVDITTANVRYSEDKQAESGHRDTSVKDTPAAERPPGKQSVLIIDDSPTVRRLAELTLSKEGYDVFTAEDGDVGLEIARREMPSVILVDFIMPKMNGFQLCKTVRSDPLLKDTPIVLITSKGKDVGEGFDEKFNIARYLQKPFETDVLIKTVREVLPVREEEPDTVTAADSQAPLQTDALPKDVPSPESTPTNVTPSGDQTVETLPSDISFAGTQQAEHPEAEKEQAAPAYANLQENVEKEIRYYFGQELAVLLKSTVVQALKETDLVRSSRRILTGEVTYISVADILQLISMSSLSGKLSVLTNNFSSEIYLDNGLIAFASISKPGYRTCLEELIAKEGKISGRDMRAVFSEAGGSNLAAGAILLERGLITEDELTDYYRLLSEDAVHQTLSAASGHFYIEDVPLPREIQSIKLRIPSNGARR